MEHSPEAYESKGQITTRKPTVEDGAFVLDDMPGLGVAIDTEVLTTLAIEG
jgi:L-alanine-DL-glutamate epimerase-like enolase superfamily enzyme